MRRRVADREDEGERTEPRVELPLYPRLWFDDATRTRPVLLGLAPSPSGRPGAPAVSQPPGEEPTSSTARLLQELLGEPASVSFACANLLARAGDERSVHLIRERSALVLDLVRNRRVVCLGRIVGRAISGEACEGWMRWHELDSSTFGPSYGTYAVLPHPSGLNRWWNDRRNRELARTFLRRLVGGGAAGR